MSVEQENPILSPDEIVRAWKDAGFRESLTEEQRAALPPAPSDIAELSDEELEEVAGGRLQDDDCTCTQGCTGTKGFTAF